MTISEALRYIEWAGGRSNILRCDRRKLDAAVAVAREAPALLTVDRGPCGPMEVIGRLGDRVAYRDGRDDAGWGCHFCPCEVGGLLSQKVAQFVLAPDSPSRYIRGVYAGGALALTRDDARTLGIDASPRKLDPPEVALLFGANVEVV